MIRSCNHSSFPKRADHPLNEPLNEARDAFTAGNLDAEAWATAVDEATTLAVAEQARAFIEIVTDGQLGWSGAHQVAADWLDGVETGETIDGLQPGTQEQQLVIRGAIQRNGSIAKRTYEVAKRVALTQVVKVALPGPVALARRADDQHYGDLDALCDAFAEVLEAEVKELAAAGAVAFQLDEPLLGQHPEDVDRVIRTAGRIFAAAGEGAMTTLSTYFGDLGAIVDRWADLPGTHLGLEALEGSANLELLSRLPEGRGVYLGAFDVSKPEEEDADDIIKRIEPYREALTSRDVIVGPNAGTEHLDRDVAFDKVLHARYVAEQLARDWEWAE